MSPSKSNRPPSGGATPTLLAVAAVLIILANFLLLCTGYQIGTSVDDGYYITLARSIATGHGFSEVNDPLAPKHELWPPGFPLLLAPVALAAGNSLVPFRLFSALVTLVSLAIVLVYLRNLLPTSRALWVTAITGSSTIYAGNACMVMSEPAFTAVFLAILLVTGQEASTSWRRSGGLGLLCGLAYLIRPVGIVCGLAVTLHALAVGKRRRAIWVAACVSIVVSLWSIRNLQVSGNLVGHQHYVKMMGVETVMRNLHAYPLRIIPTSLLPFLDQPRVVRLCTGLGLRFVLPGIAVACLAVVVIGLAAVVRDSRRRFELIMLGMYATVLIVWPLTRDGNRLLYPALPFLIAWFFSGLDVVLSPLSSKVSRRTTLAVAVGMLVIWTTANAALWHNPTRSRIRDISVGSDWIRQHASQGAVVLADWPQSIWLYAGRATIGPASMFDQYIRSGRHIDYVLIGPRLDRPYTEPALLRSFAANPTLQLVYRDEHHQTYVFAHTPGAQRKEHSMKNEIDQDSRRKATVL